AAAQRDNWGALDCGYAFISSADGAKSRPRIGIYTFASELPESLHALGVTQHQPNLVIVVLPAKTSSRKIKQCPTNSKINQRKASTGIITSPWSADAVGIFLSPSSWVGRRYGERVGYCRRSIDRAH